MIKYHTFRVQFTEKCLLRAQRSEMQKGTLTEFSVLVLSSLKYSPSAKTFNVLLASQNCDPVKLRDLNTNKHQDWTFLNKPFVFFSIQVDAIATDYQPVFLHSLLCSENFFLCNVLGFSPLLRPKFNLICIVSPTGCMQVSRHIDKWIYYYVFMCNKFKTSQKQTHNEWFANQIPVPVLSQCLNPPRPLQETFTSHMWHRLCDKYEWNCSHLEYLE